MRKQLHRCRQTGCSAKGHCQYGFPFPAQPAHNTTVDAASQRYSYHRPAQCDAHGCLHRNVVPYHPAVLLLWNAHMNIQRITDASWSLYILKYTVRRSSLTCCAILLCTFLTCHRCLPMSSCRAALQYFHIADEDRADRHHFSGHGHIEGVRLDCRRLQ